MDWLFELYDVGNTNNITREEALEVIEVIHDLHSGMLPAENRVSPQELTDHIFKRADHNNDGKVDRQAFVNAAGQSKTLKILLDATAKVASQPFTIRKERSGSFGRKMVDYSSRSRSGSQLSGGSGSRRGSFDGVLQDAGRTRAYSAIERVPQASERANTGRPRAGSVDVPKRFRKVIGPGEVSLGAVPTPESVKL